MATVEEIEQAIERLAPADFARLASWVALRRHEEWTKQMDRDAEAGKLDFLFSEADAEGRAGALRNWPPAAQ
jgi:hypothetical protein